MYYKVRMKMKHSRVRSTAYLNYTLETHDGILQTCGDDFLN